MPLVKGPAARTRSGIKKNIQIEKIAGKPTKQSIAIALSVVGKSKKSKKPMKKSDGY